MLVSRSDVIARRSIQRDSCVTGANAIASSDDGSGTLSAWLRTKASLAGPAGTPGSIGFHSSAGTSPAVSTALRGPIRRSTSGAIDVRQLPAAISRSADRIDTCISFSASANVEAVTSGPVPAEVLNAAGAPGVAGGSGLEVGGGGARLITAAGGGRDAEQSNRSLNQESPACVHSALSLIADPRRLSRTSRSRRITLLQ